VSDEFLVWFDREYPMDETGSRTKYKETCVMDLMRSAFEARRTVSADAEKDAARYRFLEDQCRKGAYRGIISREAIDAAILAANKEKKS
jgi:hypothetical protein